MSTERDELAEAIDENFEFADYRPQFNEAGEITGSNVADAIRTLGYRKPRTVTTAEELEALPDDSVIRDSAGDVAEKRGGVWCAYETAPMTNRRLAKYTPITVLWEPQS